jgi:hypothetical protein
MTTIHFLVLSSAVALAAIIFDKLLKSNGEPINAFDACRDVHPNLSSALDKSGVLHRLIAANLLKQSLSSALVSFKRRSLMHGWRLARSETLVSDAIYMAAKKGERIFALESWYCLVCYRVGIDKYRRGVLIVFFFSLWP